MIKEVTMYTAECDECGCVSEFGDFSCLPHPSDVEEDAGNNGWYFDNKNNKCYCEDCHRFDEDDNLIIKNKYQP